MIIKISVEFVGIMIRSQLHKFKLLLGIKLTTHFLLPMLEQILLNYAAESLE